ncbi:MAG: hypothetical protein N2Z72_03575, partial [Bacteroidales bacterium]|nr:hypothetical protein [Bacteroidales bacterium]
QQNNGQSISRPQQTPNYNQPTYEMNNSGGQVPSNTIRPQSNVSTGTSVRPNINQQNNGQSISRPQQTPNYNQPTYEMNNSGGQVPSNTIRPEPSNHNQVKETIISPNYYGTRPNQPYYQTPYSTSPQDQKQNRVNTPSYTPPAYHRMPQKNEYSRPTNSSSSFYSPSTSNPSSSKIRESNYSSDRSRSFSGGNNSSSSRPSTSSGSSTHRR